MKNLRKSVFTMPRLDINKMISSSDTDLGNQIFYRIRVNFIFILLLSNTIIHRLHTGPKYRFAPKTLQPDGPGLTLRSSAEVPAEVQVEPSKPQPATPHKESKHDFHRNITRYN